MIEEIVVTATYRDTQLMDTPIALSAVTDVEIMQKGIQDDIRTLYQSDSRTQLSSAQHV